ncbi:putative reverse transcriptase domain-containing protein [Tanacetum coccineum]
MTNTRSGMTPTAIEEMINQSCGPSSRAPHGLTEILNSGMGITMEEEMVMEMVMEMVLEMETMEATMSEKMKTMFHIRQLSERRISEVCDCTLHDSALTWWKILHKRTIETDAAYALSWRELLKLKTEVYCLRNEIQKMETELWNLSVKNNDMVTYTQRFQELTMMYTKMVPEERTVEKFIGRLNNNYGKNRGQQPPFKRQNTGGQNVARAYMAGNNEKKEYEGHPFNIDLMPVDLGSFDVIIGMDWLAKNHAMIVCDEKIVCIPYGNEILTVQGDKSDKEKKSTRKKTKTSEGEPYSKEDTKEEHDAHLRLILELLKKEELYAKFSNVHIWLVKGNATLAGVIAQEEVGNLQQSQLREKAQTSQSRLNVVQVHVSSFCDPKGRIVIQSLKGSKGQDRRSV